MASILIPPRIQFIDNNGEPIVNGKVYTYEAGTSVPKLSWKDQTETSSNTNPVILDDAGRAQIWIRGAYKIVVHDADDVLIYEDDDVISYTDVDFTGLTATVADLNSTNTSGIVVTNNYSVQLEDRGKTILANAVSTAITVNLLAVATATNRYRITIKKIDLSSNIVLVQTNGTELIDDVDGHTLYDYGDFIEILCDGGAWQIVASKIRGSIVNISAAHSIDLSNDKLFYNCTTTTGNVVVSLPAISTVGKGFEVGFKKIDSSVNRVIVNPDGAETIDDSTSLEIEKQYRAYTLKSDISNWSVTSDLSSGISGVISNKYIAGLETSQVAPDPDHDIQIEPGVFADANNNALFELSSAIIKEINNTWAEGDLAGGLANALTLTADTWYHVFALAKLNGTVDAGYDTSLTATNLLADGAVQSAGYQFYRRVASLRTDGSANIKDYHQTYDTFLFDDPDNYYQYIMVAPEQTHLFPVDVPPGFRVEAIMNLQLGSGYAYSTPPFVSTLIPAISADPLYTYQAPGSFEGGRKIYIITDESQQIKQTHSSAVGNRFWYVVTLGWKDWRLD